MSMGDIRDTRGMPGLPTAAAPTVAATIGDKAQQAWQIGDKAWQTLPSSPGRASPPMKCAIRGALCHSRGQPPGRPTGTGHRIAH